MTNYELMKIGSCEAVKTISADNRRIALEEALKELGVFLGKGW